MSRKDDILYVEENIKLLQNKQQAVVDSFNLKNQQAEKAREKLLSDAGLVEQLRAIAVSKQQSQTTSQEELDQLNADVSRLQTILEFLNVREEETSNVLGNRHEEVPDIDFDDFDLSDFDDLVFDEETNLPKH